MKKAKVLVLVCVLSVFAIVGQAGAACTAFSNWPTETPPATGTLGAPQGLMVTVGDGSITVSWSAVTGATGYKLGINDGTNIAWVTTTQTSYTFSGTVGGKVSITNGKEYQIKVATENENDTGDKQYGAFSSVLCATPTAPTTTTTTAPTTTSTTAPTTTSSTAPTTTSSTTTTTTLPALPNCAQMGNYKAKMDVNGDGKIDANDAALIIRYLKLNCQSQ